MKNLLLLITLLIITVCVYPQGAAINSTGASAHSSAMLDISSTDAGILIPRMTEYQKGQIQNPEIGLMIYQTDATTGFWYFDGNIWVQAIGATGPTGPAGPSGANGFLPSGSSAGNTPYWDGTQWVVTSSNIYNNGSSVGIGTNNPDLSAAIDIYSTNKGALIPRMTTSERDLISLPADGLQIFNTTTKCFEFYLSNVWQSMSCGCTVAPASPTAGNITATGTEIIWAWQAVIGATGYKYNTTPDYNTATDNSVITSVKISGLNYNTSYNLYVWAYNACGNSNHLLLTQTTMPFNCGVDNVTFTYNSSQVTYGSVSGQYNSGQYCWLDRNLGAAVVATASNHYNGYGDLYQWGRLSDGHQLRSPISGATTSQSSSINPGHPNFIYNSYNWYTGSTSLWQGVSGVNNPCPSGWRVPTETELNNETLSWGGGRKSAGAISSVLKVPAAGYRAYDLSSTIYSEGTQGCYWTSTMGSSNYARSYTFTSSSDEINTPLRAFGRSVRCIKD